MKTIVLVLTTVIAICSGYSIIESPYQHHHYRDSHHHQIVEEHIPIIGKDGVPLDTPEVQEAKRQHAIAHEAAKAREHHHHHEEPDFYHQHDHETYFHQPENHHLSSHHDYYHGH